LEKSVDKKINGKYNLDIWTKDNRQLNFSIINEDFKFYCLLNKFSFPSEESLFSRFALKYCIDHKKMDQGQDFNGWNVFNLEKELERMGVDFKNSKTNRSRYRVSSVNDKYKVCTSYPKKIVIPQFFSDEDIIDCSIYRFRGRIPILSFQYKENKCCIWRSSQPRSGLMHLRNQSDEKLLRATVDYSDKLVIYDMRPYLNALANRVKIFTIYFYYLKFF
jgi:hypothetical protein